MKITVVGSSHGVPEANRKCASFLIEVGENVYFVDMGTPGIDALRSRGLAVEAVKGIFITHMHGDHTNGLIPFVDLITWYFKKADPDIYLPLPEAAEAIRAWLKVTLNGEEMKAKFHPVTPGVMYDDGVLKVTSIPTQHCHKSGAYLIEAEGKTVLITGDLKNPGIDFPAVAMERPLDLVICESAHFPATDYLPVFAKCDIKKVCVTHYSNRFLASVLQLMQELQVSGKDFVMATDDLQLNL